ncbi:LamG-like jellyroll fold domain-containing protein [Microbacterium sulfonylureivorans]|uniref:galactose-binding domain-containing protein n=1 Tax=Microbacterium sulfonylureivorans TaxID=2486854 RepID=UPI0013DECA14|nr:LamG-like jellyroll fold domain-containing protein [Microbacterium sulfonylureivorans]
MVPLAALTISAAAISDEAENGRRDVMMNNSLGRVTSLLLGLALVVATLALTPTSASAAGADYYVSATSGSDTNAGSSTSAPFKTIQRAANVAVSGDTVHIMAGTYREKVTPANSGTASDPITFKKYNDDEVIISGLEVVPSTGWQLDAGNVYKHTVPDSDPEMGLENAQVFVGGVEMTLGRWPNTGRAAWSAAPNVDFMTTEGDTWIEGATTGAEIPGGDDAWTGGIVTALARSGWGFYPWKITDYTQSNHRITLNGAGLDGNEYGWQLPTDMYPDDKEFVLMGARVAVDVENEFYVDYANDTLYLYAPGGGSPGSNVEIKTRKWGFDLGNANYIHIEGVKLRGAGIRAWDSHDSVIDRVELDYPAVSRLHYTEDVDLEGFAYSGWRMSTDSGVLLGGARGKNHFGHSNTLKNSTVKNATTTAAVTLGGTGHNVVNNEITDSAMGIWANGSDFLISYNTIARMQMNALHGYYHDTIVEHNDISSMLQDGQTDDGATHPYAMDMGNSVWRYNRIHDFSALAALYADNATMNLGIHRNVVYDINGPWGAMVNGRSENVAMYHNTFVNPGQAGFNFWDLPGYNVFGANNIAARSTFQTTMVGSTKSHNLENTDPLFVNEGGHDLRLQSTSPAIDAGMVLPGISDGYTGSAPDAGAYEKDGAGWTAGHDFDNPPAMTSSTGVWPRMNHVKNSSFDARVWGGAIANLTWHDGWNISDSTVAVHQAYGESWDEYTKNTRSSAVLQQGDWITQTITGLSPNTTYTAGAYLRMDTAGVGSATMTVENFGGSAVTPVSGNADAMQHRTLEFTTGPSSTTATIKISKDATTANAAYVANVSLTENLQVAGLIGHWKLDESSGTVAADSSGNSANGTVSGTTSWVAGKSGNALSLGSATSHADIGSHDLGNAAGVTLSMWVKTTSTSTNSYLFGGWDGPGVQFTYNTGGAGGGKVNLYHSSFGRINSTTSVNDGSWHMVTWRYVKGDTFKIYVDGAEEATANVGTINWDDWYWIIGAQGSSKTEGFNGSIDDVRLYNTALAPSAIQQLYYAPENLAQGKTATQSSTYGSAGASRAVDGITDGDYFAGSVTSTGLEANASWQVDLGQARAIGDIQVWNRTDLVPERLSDYWVFVSSVPFTPGLTAAQRVTEGVATGFHQTTQAGSPTTIPADVTGRYVMVQLAGTNYLSLAEVKVLAPVTNFAQGKTATQSSTYTTAAASKAVDGITNGNYFAGSVTSTQQEAHASWQVDLGQTRAIGDIRIWNRTDAAPERLSDYWVFVSPVPFTSGLTPAQRVTEGVATGFHQTAQAGSPTMIPADVSGRYVMVQLSGTNYLHLAEVKVLPDLD